MSPHPDKFNRCSEAGFTLVEALVSLVLLTTALVPAFILATDAVRLSTSIRNTLTAANLAQEGVEVVRAMRDANWFAGQPLEKNLANCSSPDGCRVQWDSKTPDAIGGNPRLKWDKTTGLYQYSTGDPTLFSRKITVDLVPGPLGATIGLVVKSEVTWTERSVTDVRSIVVETHLFDWIQ